MTWTQLDNKYSTWLKAPRTTAFTRPLPVVVMVEDCVSHTYCQILPKNITVVPLGSFRGRRAAVPPSRIVAIFPERSDAP